jgi:hypothetical protein
MSPRPRLTAAAADIAPRVADDAVFVIPLLQDDAAMKADVPGR